MNVGLAGILGLINAAIPNIVTTIMMIRNQDGTHTAVFYLDSADAQFAANQKQISDWMAAHQAAKPVTPLTP